METSHFLWPAYCIKAGKSHASAVERLFLLPPLPFFPCWLNTLKSERLWHCFDRPTSEIPLVDEIKGVWCPALTEEVQMSLFLSTSTYIHGVGEKRRHIELLVLSFRPSLGGYRLWQCFIYAPMRLQVCAWETLWESVRQCENQMGIQTPPCLPPEPWQRSAGQSQLTHQKRSNQTEVTEAICVAGKLHKNEMFTQTWNGIEKKWSQMTPHTSFRSWLQSVLFRQGFMDLTGICQYDLQWCE